MGRFRNAVAALFERKESATGPIIARRYVGRAVPRLERFDDFAREGYQKNVIAFRAIRSISDAVASLPLQLFKGEIEQERTHLAFQRLRRANPMQSGQSFIGRAISFFLIAGNSYLETVGPANAEPRELYSLRPDRMDVVAGSRGLPAGYTYTVGRDRTTFEVDPITGASDLRHLKTFHPLDDWYGMSPIQAAAVGINQFNEAGIWNQNLLLRGASRGGILEMQAQEGRYDLLDEDTRKTLLKRLDEQFAGPENAGRWKIIEGGLKFEGTTFSPQDMDWINSKHTSARDVCGAFDYPCQLLGIPGDNTYSNYKEARQALYENTIMPLGWMFFGELTEWWLPRFGDDLHFKIDEDQVLGLSPRREALWDRVNAANFLSPNEKREATGFGPHEPDPLDPATEIYLPAGQLPLSFGLGFTDNPEAFEKALLADGVPKRYAKTMVKLAFGESNGEWKSV